MNLDGFKYYGCIICYVDNMLFIYHKPQKLMNSIQEEFKLKEDKIEPPELYLGDTLAKMKLESG